MLAAVVRRLFVVLGPCCWLVAAGCAEPAAAPVVPTRPSAALEVTLRADAASRQLLGLRPFDVVTLSLTGQGGREQKETLPRELLEEAGAKVTFQAMEPGWAWVQAYAYDADEREVGTGFASTELVAGQTGTLAVTIFLTPQLDPTHRLLPAAPPDGLVPQAPAPFVRLGAGLP